MTSDLSAQQPAARWPVRDAASIVVASVPATHVYVRHLSPPDGGGPTRLPDPDPDDRTRSAEQRWWPPVMLRASWAAEADFDLMHIQFGFDAEHPHDLAELTRVLRRRGKPLVHTVHDLRNPHHQSRELHDAQLDVLLPAADAVVTLTAGAAAEIKRRWGRVARVVPHPHVVDIPTMTRARVRRENHSTEEFRVGLHLKSLRASMDPMRILPTLVRTAAALPGCVLQVNAHRDVLDRDGARRDAELAEYLDRRAAEGALELRVHDYFTDAQLWDYLGALDASVLPYRFGTHSGWLEACRDLGTTVIAPTCGYYSDQGPVLSFVHDESHFDARSLTDAVTRAWRERPQLGATVEERCTQRRQVADAHAHIYRSLLW